MAVGHLHRHISGVWLGRGRHLTVHADRPVPYEIDGEMIGHTPVEITLLPQRLHGTFTVVGAFEGALLIRAGGRLLLVRAPGPGSPYLGAQPPPLPGFRATFGSGSDAFLTLRGVPEPPTWTGGGSPGLSMRIVLEARPGGVGAARGE